MMKYLFISMFVFAMGFHRVSAQMNYALTKTVSSSPVEDAKRISNITDGYVNDNNYWASSGKTQNRELVIDLNADFKIGGAHIYFLTKNSFAPKNFEFQFKQGDKWITFEGGKVENNYSNNIRLQFGNIKDTPFVKVVFNASSRVIISEIALWGTDVPPIGEGIDMEEPKPFVATEHWICVNQVSYNLYAPKRFTVPTAKTNLPFSIYEHGGNQVVYDGVLQNKLGDFTKYQPKHTDGKEYIIRIEGDGLPSTDSYPFMIEKQGIQKMAYQPVVEFMNDARSMVGSHPSAYGGTAWRDGTYYTYELPSMVMVYLSNPEVFNDMPVSLDWQKEKEFLLSDRFKPTKEPNDKYARKTVTEYYSKLPKPKDLEAPDIVQCIRYGTGWNLLQPISADPSGDPLGWQMHSQTIEQFAYFLFGYPAYEQYISRDFYQMVLDSTIVWWGASGLFDVITVIGNPKGRHCPGHSIMPNLLMYEVAKREKLDNPEKYLQAAFNQTQWVIDSLDWNDPTVTKGQRISEHKLVTGIAHFQLNYPEKAPKGLDKKIEEWADVAVALSDNEWDLRRFDMEENWTLPGYNEVGNIIGFPACAISAALALNEGKVKDRLIELAYAHFDNFNGRNPANAHCANHPELGFEGIDKGWPHGDPRRDVCARLEHVRGSLSSLPGSEMYPFNPLGKPRHGEGWTSYNANWNVSLTYLNIWEGIASKTLLKEIKTQ